MKFFKRPIKKRYIILAILVVFIIISMVRGAQKKDDLKEFTTVEKGLVSETIILAGDVDMGSRVDLGFGSSGRVADVLVAEGDVVQKGDVLARLSMNQLSAELLEAEANLRQAEAENLASGVDLSYAYQKLQNTIIEQDTLVENAYRTLLSDSLEAHTEDYTNAEAPTISGTYFGNEEGDYYISVYSSSAPSGYSFTVSGLESGYGTVKTNASSPLGSQGLYIQFAEGELYGNSDWIVSIPNTRSDNYTAKKNAYEQALATRSLAIASAEDEYKQAAALESENSLSESGAGVLAAQARVESVRAQMGDGIIRAPFDGVVGLLDIAPGEIVSGNTAYITLVGGDQFELSLDVPEIDVAKLAINDEVTISLDAYMDGSTWQGVISAIDIIDTLVDGVPVYKTKVLITNPDERVRVGMSAKATILAEEKEGVLRAPRYFFERSEEGYSARVVVGEKKEEERIVTLGLEGSDGFVEIVGGLVEGDTLVRTKTPE